MKLVECYEALKKDGNKCLKPNCKICNPFAIYGNVDVILQF
jgi:hypothetical protein